MRLIHCFFWILLVPVSCSPTYRADPILDLGLDADYYKQSIQGLERQLIDDPENLDLIKLQLTHYDHLGWPSEAHNSISRAKLTLGTDPVFLSQAITFYTVNGLNDELFSFIDTYSQDGQISKSMERARIDALLSIDKIAGRKALEEFETDSMASGDWAYLIQSYLSLEDEVLAVYYFRKAMKNEVDLSLIANEIVPALDKNGLHQILLSVYRQGVISPDEHLVSIARASWLTGDTLQAKQLLTGEGEDEGYYLLSEIYMSESLWDSAHFSIDQILMDDPLNQRALLAKGDLDQERGYFTRSLGFYQQVLMQDSTQAYALDQVQIVNRKIAYLQKIRESQRKIPTLELESKTVNNN